MEYAVPYSKPMCSLGWCVVAGQKKQKFPIAPLNNTSFFFFLNVPHSVYQVTCVTGSVSHSSQILQSARVA